MQPSVEATGLWSTHPINGNRLGKARALSEDVVGQDDLESRGS